MDGISPDAGTFCLVLRASESLSARDRADQAYLQHKVAEARALVEEEMEGRFGVAPTENVLDTLLRLYAAASRITSAQDVVHKLYPRFGLEPSAHARDVLVRLLLRTKRYDAALEEYAALKKSGAPVSGPLALALLRAKQRAEAQLN